MELTNQDFNHRTTYNVQRASHDDYSILRATRDGLVRDFQLPIKKRTTAAAAAAYRVSVSSGRLSATYWPVGTSWAERGCCVHGMSVVFERGSEKNKNNINLGQYRRSRDCRVIVFPSAPSVDYCTEAAWTFTRGLFAFQGN